MLEQIDIAQTLFLDIETVSSKATFSELPEVLQDLWKYKAAQLMKPAGEEITDEEAQTAYEDRAAIYAEFGKIICISVGAVHRDKDGKLKVRLKSFASDDEVEVLTAFSQLLQQYYHDPNKQYLCGHNIKEFDVPYICRRMVVNSLPLPKLLDLTGRKPWETKHLLDTLELWKFGDRKAYTSLKLLAAVLDFPSPKDDIDGSQVGRVYWKENGLERIAHYCEKDVLATVQLFRRFQRAPILEGDQIIHVE